MREAIRVTAAAGASPFLAGPGRREIVFRSSGSHAAIDRLISPEDTGELVKPFVFLDYFDFVPEGGKLFGIHPHSGLAAMTVLLSGDLRYEDTTGAAGELHGGSVEWLRAGMGVWHDGWPISGARIRGYQLWVALPPSLENAAAGSQYLAAGEVPSVGPARVVLGTHGKHRSRIDAPDGVVVLHVRLATGERWQFQPAAGHAVAWVHCAQGGLRADDQRIDRELVVFGESEVAIGFQAERDTEFILASGVKHPHPLVLGSYSVHTSSEALATGEAEIARIGRVLRNAGRLG
jgi:redox-sensitive bicupin YhaK (pirin superfamily)